jgi:SAM-dependent methyltransferase
MSSDMSVLDFGAGRGRDAIDDPVLYRRSLRILKGKVKTVVGVDVDASVLGNPSLDCAIVVDEDGPLPFPSSSIDLIVSDFCFEHLRFPESAARELTRVLKPGGWICARTPNRWGYIALGGRLFPNRIHRAMLRHLQPGRQAHDIFPTAYLLNTRKRIREEFPAAVFYDYSYGFNGEPAYFGRSLVANRVAKAILACSPEAYSALLYIFLQKHTSD